MIWCEGMNPDTLALYQLVENNRLHRESVSAIIKSTPMNQMEFKFKDFYSHLGVTASADIEWDRLLVALCDLAYTHSKPWLCRLGIHWHKFSHGFLGPPAEMVFKCRCGHLKAVPL